MMEEAKYFICVVEIEDSSEDRFEIRMSFRPIIKFFGSKKAAEEWAKKKYRRYDLSSDKSTGRCLAAWKGKQGNRKEVKIALFEVSLDGIFTMPKEWAVYLE